MEIKIVSYSPGPCEILEGFSKLKNETDVNIEATPHMRFSQNSDLIGFQIDINFWTNNEVVVRFGFLIGMVANGWSESFSEGKNPVENKSIIKAFCEKAWLVGTGLFMARSKEKLDKALILPDIDLNKFAGDVNFIDATRRL